jgi:hypothetical protein
MTQSQVTMKQIHFKEKQEMTLLMVEQELINLKVEVEMIYF